MDIAISWNAANFRGDWTVTMGDLVIDPGGLRSAVLMSLFTDRAAPPDYTPPAGSTYGRRGYWADSFEPYPIGSWLWLLDRSKKTGSLPLLIDAQNYCSLALQWLIDGGVVASVQTSAVWRQPDIIGLLVGLTKPDGIVVSFDYDYAWLGA